MGNGSGIPTTSSSPADGRCPQILFAKEDGLYWLRGSNLARARNLLRHTDGEKAVGFDDEMVKVYVQQLSEQGISVGIIEGSTLRTIAAPKPSKPAKVASTTRWLSPALLFGHKELDRLESLSCKNLAFADMVERIRGQLGNGASGQEYGALFVYQVADEVYEVDWELTGIPKAIVEALAACQTGQFLRCEVVEPKAKRSHALRHSSRTSSTPGCQFILGEPAAYGQLRLGI